MPEGEYIGKHLRRRTNKAMTCGDSVWSLDLEPNFQTDRTLLRIHPDGNRPGTEGCIGIICTSAENLYHKLREYFGLGNDFILVEVSY